MYFLQSHSSLVVQTLSVLTIVGQMIAVTLIACLVVEIISKRHSPCISWVSGHALLLMLIVAIIATSGSLYFSDIAGWTPCKDCWYQRIFMYPQVLLLAIALWKKDRHIALYILILSIIGMGIAIDHYADQVEAAFAAISAPEVDPLTPCDNSGVSCAKTEIDFTFGYITIPMMALTAFALHMIGSLSILRRQRKA